MNENKPMQTHAIILHGLGRTPFSMRRLAARLGKEGIRPHRFCYCAAFESIEHCKIRLQRFIESHVGTESYIVIGHSLGSVLLRTILPKLDHQPIACFFLAPPTKACRAAKFFKTNFLFRLIAGNMGQLLGDDNFMKNLPVPKTPTVVYAGTSGLSGRWSPFQNEKNDGILAFSETALPSARIEYINSLHSFIMNSSPVIKDIITTTQRLMG